MAVTFALADLETRMLVGRAMSRYPPRLAEAGVEVGVLFASSDKTDVPALKSKGTTLRATMKVVALRDRVLKRVDAEMCINKELWDESNSEGKLALCHHELLHLDLKDWKYAPVFDEHGKPRYATDSETGLEVRVTELQFERDDLGRPVLVSVHGDIDVGDGFQAVVVEHGRAAPEYQNCHQAGRWSEQLMDKHLDRQIDEIREGRQRTMDFQDPDQETVETTDSTTEAIG